MTLFLMALLAASPVDSLVGYTMSTCALGDDLTHGFYSDGPMWPDGSLTWPRAVDAASESIAMTNHAVYSVPDGEGTRGARCADLYTVLDNHILMTGRSRTRGCKRLYLMCGTHDLEAGRLAVDVYADIQAMLSRAAPVPNFSVVLLTVPPLDGAPWYTPAVAAEHMALNALIRSTPGILTPDAYAALATDAPLPVPYPGDGLPMLPVWRNEPLDFVRPGIAGAGRIAASVLATPGAVPP